MNEPTIEAVQELCSKYGLRYGADLMQWLADNLAELEKLEGRLERLRDEIGYLQDAGCGECIAKDTQIEDLQADLDAMRSRLAKPE